MKMRLNDLADVRIGYPSRGRIQPDASSPYRIIQLRDVKGDVEWRNVIRFQSDGQPERYLVGDGDVLISSRGASSVGVTLSEVPENTVASSNFYVVRVKHKGLLPEYVAWYLNQPAAREYFRSRTQGTNISLITKSDIGELEVPIPALATQEQVVRLAKLRRMERQLLHQLESRRDLLIQTVCQSAISPAKHREV